MITASAAPSHSVVGSTAPIGPLADRSGVVNASMIWNASLSSHSAADHRPVIAAFHTSPTAAERRRRASAAG